MSSPPVLSQSRWILLFTLVVSSTIGFFYYLRILAAMYAKAGDTDTAPAEPILPLPATLALAVLTGLVFLLGLYPTPLWNAIVSAAGKLG